MNEGAVAIRFERIAPSGGYGIAHRAADGGRVIAQVPAGAAYECSVPADSCYPLPEGLDVERALLIPPLAFAINAWDRLGLALGEAAVVTSGAVEAEALAAVARWRCGRRAIWLDLGDATPPPSGIEAVATAEPQAAIEFLAGRLRGVPGAAAVVLGSSAKAVDVLLEALPSWSRIGIAAAMMDRTAVDFYNRVHRSCSTLLGLPSSAALMLDPARRNGLAPALRQAGAVLGHPMLARDLLAAAS